MSQAPHVLFWLFRVWGYSLVGFNFLSMLISPKVWTRLPWWLTIPARNTIMSETTKEQFSAGWGAAVIRLVGACGIIWTIYIVFSRK